MSRRRTYSGGTPYGGTFYILEGRTLMKSQNLIEWELLKTYNKASDVSNNDIYTARHLGGMTGSSNYYEGKLITSRSVYNGNTSTGLSNCGKTYIFSIDLDTYKATFMKEIPWSVIQDGILTSTGIDDGLLIGREVKIDYGELYGLYGYGSSSYPGPLRYTYRDDLNGYYIGSDTYSSSTCDFTYLTSRPVLPIYSLGNASNTIKKQFGTQMRLYAENIGYLNEYHGDYDYRHTYLGNDIVITELLKSYSHAYKITEWDFTNNRVIIDSSYIDNELNLDSFTPSGTVKDKSGNVWLIGSYMKTYPNYTMALINADTKDYMDLIFNDESLRFSLYPFRIFNLSDQSPYTAECVCQDSSNSSQLYHCVFISDDLVNWNLVIKTKLTYENNFSTDENGNKVDNSICFAFGNSVNNRQLDGDIIFVPD